eukprot:560338-Prymnesium_polylepis.2
MHLPHPQGGTHARRGVVWRGAVRRCAVWRGAERCCAVWRGAVRRLPCGRRQQPRLETRLRRRRQPRPQQR